MVLQQLKIHFRGARTYVASPHPDSPPFTVTLPSNVNRIVIHQLRQNWSEGKPVREYSYQDAGLWGAPGGFDDVSVAYAPGIADGGLRLCLRMAFNTDTLNKDSCCYATLQNLIKDAEFYSDNIKANDCNRYTVPLHYGLWILDTGDWAGRIVVSISKWGGRPWSHLLRTRYNTLENRLLIGRAVERLHDAGVLHGQIRHYKDWRHVLIDVDDRSLSEEDKKNGKAPCHIVGFSSSCVHDCERQLPIIEHDSFNTTYPLIGCNEVANVAFMLGFLPVSVPDMSNGPTNKAMQALQWRDDYVSRHPHLEERVVSIAQRAKFYRTCCAYHGLLIYSLGDEGTTRLLPDGIDDRDDLEEIQVMESSVGEDKIARIRSKSSDSVS